ncbi:PTS transporter subunit EIIC [Breznakia pachnodae]|uniref:PTS system beta-glucosides-specific IIC component n=1 Tax=Breznakia pachnodae TaxID=265178 RepID=A0ABU0E4H9_9FIRM|nr:PTS transporter subunit EIIC [Breznakia pachnodae]MDQ0361816.1 PTS system beta-glucosides-specific IIC component [Breznakia pachnodae]
MNKKELATSIIEKVGGADNIEFVTHCITRLRFRIKDMNKVDVDSLKATSDVMGVVDKGGQLQLIIGPAVQELFSEVSSQLPNTEVAAGEEEPKKKDFSLKGIGNTIMDVVGACIAPMLPILTAAGLIKLIVALLGPTMLNVLPETNDLMRLLTFVGDAGFYFFPMYVAYGAAKKFNTSIPLSLFIAGILLHPTLFQIVEEGQAFSVYGIPMKLTTYSSSFISMIMICWAMSYLEKGLRKVIPTALKSMLLPLLTVLIMLPIALCILGPVGAFVGDGLAVAITKLHEVLGPIAVGLVAALWPLLIATGMHQALIAVGVTQIATQGFESIMFVGASIGNYALIAISLAYLIKIKGAENKAYASSSAVTLILGGISEPVLFGILLRYKRSIIYLLASGFAGGLIAGLLSVKYYFFGATNILAFLSFAGGESSNMTYAIIACAVTFVIAFVMSMIFGFGEDDAVVEIESENK